MVVNPPEPDERWAYRRPAVERIFAAVRRMLLEKAGKMRGGASAVAQAGSPMPHTFVSMTHPHKL